MNNLSSHFEEYVKLKESLVDIAFERGETIRYSPSIPFIYASLIKDRQAK